MDGIVELAKMFKERNNKSWSGIQVGVVEYEFPEIKIRLGDVILLDKSKLLFSSHVLSGYEREFAIEGDLEFTDSDAGQTSVNSSHSHSIQSLSVNTQYKSNGKIKLTDTLKKGDKVILVPTADEQYYYVIDKAVTL